MDSQSTEPKYGMEAEQALNKAVATLCKKVMDMQSVSGEDKRHLCYELMSEASALNAFIFAFNDHLINTAAIKDPEEKARKLRAYGGERLELPVFSGILRRFQRQYEQLLENRLTDISNRYPALVKEILKDFDDAVENSYAYRKHIPTYSLI